MKYNRKDEFKAEIAVKNTAVDATSTGSVVIDRMGFHSLVFVDNVKAASYSASAYVTTTIQGSDDNSTWVDLTADQIKGDLPANKATLSADTLYKYAAMAPYRYFKVKKVLTGTLAVNVSVIAILGDPELLPVA